jgi:hypothetical protein
MSVVSSCHPHRSFDGRCSLPACLLCSALQEGLQGSGLRVRQQPDEAALGRPVAPEQQLRALLQEPQLCEERKVVQIRPAWILQHAWQSMSDVVAEHYIQHEKTQTTTLTCCHIKVDVRKPRSSGGNNGTLTSTPSVSSSSRSKCLWSSRADGAREAEGGGARSPVRKE